MKVLNLQCAHGHGFEGWFASEADFTSQSEGGAVACPLCDSNAISRLPSAPRLNLSGARESQGSAPSRAVAAADTPGDAQPLAQVQALWMKAVQHVLKNTEDVGERFPEEARRIHYGESEARGIRGHATPDERAALADEGIEVVPLPVPEALKGQSH